MKEGPLRNKSYTFAIRIVKLSQYLQSERKEFILSKQILRSGTAIGALIREAEYAESKADFIHKMSISLKEANETDYWLSLLFDTEYITEVLHKSMAKDCNELIATLVASINTTKKSSVLAKAY